MVGGGCNLVKFFKKEKVQACVTLRDSAGKEAEDPGELRDGSLQRERK